MKEISPQELKEKLKRGDAVYVIDVREPEEYAAENTGAILIPLGKFQSFELDEVEAKPEDEVVCMCRSGKRSMLACAILEQVGYTNVHNLKGGILAWSQA